MLEVLFKVFKNKPKQHYTLYAMCPVFCSGVSALVLAFHMQSADLEKPVLPVLNIPSKVKKMVASLVNNLMLLLLLF